MFEEKGLAVITATCALSVFLVVTPTFFLARSSSQQLNNEVQPQSIEIVEDKGKAVEAYGNECFDPSIAILELGPKKLYANLVMQRGSMKSLNAVNSNLAAETDTTKPCISDLAGQKKAGPKAKCC